MNKKIEKNAKLLIASDLIYSLTGVFVETFLVAYFLKVTNKNITTISIYYILIYTLTSLGNIVMGKIIKRAPDKSKQIMSFGIVARALFILFIVLLSEKIATNYILIAIIYAFSEMLYWCAHELIYIDVTNNDNRKKYMSIKKILCKIVNVISPIILGTSIEFYSFTKIAVYVFALSVIQILITLFIKTNIKKEKIQYNFKEFIEYIKTCINDDSFHILYMLRKKNIITYGEYGNGRKIDKNTIEMISNEDLKKLLNQQKSCSLSMKWNWRVKKYGMLLREQKHIIIQILVTRKVQ